jgi:phosphoglycerate dehydrogenase-like enzyme
MKVVILDDYQRAFERCPAINRLRERAQVRLCTEKLAGEALLDTLAGAQVIIPIRERTQFTAALLNDLPALELIAQTGGHAYHIDVAAASARGILIAFAPGGAGAAELTIGLMISVMRRIPQSDEALRNGGWPLVLGTVLRGKTLGILGLGKVGLEVSRIAAAFGMKVIAWGPTLTKERAEKADATFLPLDEVLNKSDIVSVHLKLSDLSKGLLNEPRLRLMRKSAYFVNTARGAIVDEAALVKVLKEGSIAGAALDVFVNEPLSPTSPLLELDNVVLTPHLGWPTDSGFESFADNATEIILNYMDGKMPRAHNPEALERRRNYR